jgi:hypothetical protein
MCFITFVRPCWHSDIDYRFPGTDYPVYLICKYSSRRMWPVDRGCLLLTWSYLLFVQRSVFAQSSRFVFHTDLLDWSLFVIHVLPFHYYFNFLQQLYFVGKNFTMWPRFPISWKRFYFEGMDETDKTPDHPRLSFRDGPWQSVVVHDKPCTNRVSTGRRPGPSGVERKN